MGGITKSIFGSNDKQTGQQVTSNQYNPQDMARLQEQSAQYQGLANNLSGFLSGLSNRALNNAPQLQTNANLNTNFQRPVFSQGLDAQSQALLAQEFQARNNQLGTQQNQIAQQFRNNPALAQILQAQAGAQSQLANNPLAFQAGNMQSQRQINEANAINQIMQGENQARLQSGEFGNTARLNQANAMLQNLQAAGAFGQQGLQTQGSVFDMLRGLADMGKTSTTDTSQQSRSAGLLGQVSGLAQPILGQTAKYDPTGVSALANSANNQVNRQYGV